MTDIRQRIKCALGVHALGYCNERSQCDYCGKISTLFNQQSVLKDWAEELRDIVVNRLLGSSKPKKNKHMEFDEYQFAEVDDDGNR